MRRHRLVVASISALLVLTACSTPKEVTQGASTAPRSGGTVIDLQAFAAGDPTHIDPALAEATQETQISRLLYDGLTKTDETGHVQHAIADSYSQSDSARLWTFHLRADALWDDGSPVLASDFAFAWQRVLDPSLESDIAGRFGLIDGADAVIAGKAKTISGVVADDAARTLTVRLVSSYQDFPALVSTTAFSPLPQALLSKDANRYEHWEDGVMIGNGPFKMASAWEHDRSIKLVRNDRYYGGEAGRKAYLDALEFRISKDIDSAYTEFTTSKNAIGRIPPGRFADARARYGNGVDVTPLLSTEYWGFNLKDSVVGGDDNLLLRQAIAMAIDKRDIVEKLYGGGRQVATGWVPPGMPGYQVALNSGGNNIEGARDLMKRWGKAAPTIRISFNAGAGHEEKASIIQQNLKDIGIDAQLDPIEQSKYNKAVGTGTVQFFRGTWNADYVSFDNFLGPLFASPPVGDQNVYGFRNAEFDALVARERAESDETARRNAQLEAERLMLKNQVVVPIDWPTSGLVRSIAVEQFGVDPLGYVDYADMWVRAI